MTDGHQVQRRPLPAAVESRERPVLPTGALRRTSRLAMLPLRHAGRTAAAASRLSRAATDQVAARTAEQLFTTLGELKGGAAKLGQAMSVFEAAMPEEVAAPYRSALRRLTDAAPAMPAEAARRVIAADLAAAYGPGLTPPPEYALVWRATLSAAGLFAQLGATVPTRGFHLAYSPGFRGGIPPARPQRTDGTLRHAG